MNNRPMQKFLDSLMAVCLAVMATSVFINVVLRYGFGSGLAASEELSRLLFVWMVFIGATAAYPKGEHMAFTSLLHPLLKPGRETALKLATRLIHALVLLSCALVGWGAWQQLAVGMDSGSVVLAEEIAKLSGGKMKLRAIGAAALGSDIQMQQALIGGTQEMMVGSTAPLVGITKEMALWDTPFLFNNAQEADAVLDGPLGDRVRAKLKEKGLIGLVYRENGFRNLTNSKHAVAKLEYLNGIKLRVMQNNVFLDSFKTLGANAIALPFSELFSALETKAVDGQ